ncbi:uncharacterized protein LOC119325917 [Triticum dicoccoides]|uniref:uncharacterized protein LOC119325917 n=1 Tax=Triticum dicoccoides TaxID=85692 RepID=UPI0018913C97|nr:uncharacterized protein LOC119325917 [Triticum dicoccoides]
MQAAIGAASWLVGKVLNKLSNELVATYVASSELGLNSEQIHTKLKYMQGLLHFAQERDVSINPGLQSLLEDLSKKADEIEDVLDELHYFMIQDQLDGTREAAPELGDGLRGHALHGIHAAKHTIGNSIPCFSCSQPGQLALPFRKKQCLCDPHTASRSAGSNDAVGKLKFDRVAMSNKIKSLIQSIHILCDPVSDLLNKIPNNSTTGTPKRPPTGSVVSQDKLYGRSVIFGQTVSALTNSTYLGETLSILPFVGPGGIGKTTFTQHLYNDKRIEGHFPVRVWVCVSTDFDVLNLTRQILRCIPAIEREEHKCTVETANLDQLQKSIAERLKSKRFYHLKFLDLSVWHGSKKLPKDISRLVNLRYFLSSKELHSNIPEVGKMKCLHELKNFSVKKEGVGFELKELGELRELGGKLTICNLETVASKGEASEAKLRNKRNLKELRLVWGTKHQTVDDDVLDGLQPDANLRVLHIINPGVGPCPGWLLGDISTKRLESLHLEGLSWCPLPAFEQLPHLNSLTLKNIAGMSVFGPGFSGVTERSFMHLKKLEFENMPKLEKWVGEPNSCLFSGLESIKVEGCPLLSLFPFLECSDLFTNLCTLHIDGCPKLSQFPPMPHTSTLTDIRVKNYGSKLLYDGKELSIKGYTRALAFHNMDKVEVMKITDVSHISFLDLQKLNSLRSIRFKKCSDMFCAELDYNVVLHSVQKIQMEELCITGKLFSKVLKCFPAVSQLDIRGCRDLELPLVDVGGLLGLRMLQSFTGYYCGNLFSRWPKEEIGEGAHTIKPFPTSLRELYISSESSMQSIGLLSNLTSLTSLSLSSCKELTIDGFNPLVTVNLKKLTVEASYETQENKSIAGDLLSEIARSNLMHAGSLQLEVFEVDSILAVLTIPICSHLAASLHTLQFSFDQWATTFTEEQEQALQLLTSLKHLKFQDCYNLQFLPQGLRGLSSLKTLQIFGCEKIQCLPTKEGLPASLEKL